MKKQNLILALLPLLSACTPDGVVLTVENPSDGGSVSQMASTPARPLLDRLGSSCLSVVDIDGREVPSQITCDSMLIFPVDIFAGNSAHYVVQAEDIAVAFDTVAWGRPYPERADDVAWENELVGFRVYGPETQRRGERAFGYDIFFKHPSDELIVPQLYRPETDPATWAKVDSLRAIDPALAEEFIASFSYHIDHGLGMDCYAVGPTLGDGVAAFVENDSILFAWCYDTVEVLDNGPLRFTARFDFAPRAVGDDSTVVEHRLVSLDSNSYLNRQLTWFDGLGAPRTICAGMPLREGGNTMSLKDIVVVSDPTQGPDNGNALLGVIMPGSGSARMVQNHSVLQRELAPSDTLTHYWGFCWDRFGFDNPEDWAGYLDEVSKAVANPVKVIVK